MIIVKKNNENFNDLVKSEGFVLVDIFAPWCGPCKMIGPVLEKVVGELNIDMIKVNSDDNEDVVRQFSIKSVPTVMLFKDGKLVDKRVGHMEYNVITDWIKSYL